MTNLLQETLKDIEHSGHTPADILFIGSGDGEYSMTWEQFEKAADVEYDAGFGAAEVAADLTVVFRDGKKMWRHEYDGSENWDYDAPGDVDYTQPGKPISILTGGMWASVSELQARATTN